MTEIWASPHWPIFTYDRAVTEPLLATAVAGIGEITGLLEGLAPADQEDLRLSQIVKEALASFSIEGVSLDPVDIEASVVASLKHRNRAAINRRSDAVVELMLAARTTDGPLTADILFAWHRLLFFGIEVEDIGQWRSHDIEIVRSAIAGSNDVLYRAPPPDRVGQEMAQFFDWLARDHTLAVPIKAALAHLWFESIHPFSDGNGRIGRALIEYVFAGSKALPFSMSRQVEKDKKAYYAALQAGRQEGRGAIDATDFVVWFLDTLAKAAEIARQEARFLVRRNRFFLRYGNILNDRHAHALQVLFDQGEERMAQGLSAKSYRKITGVSGPTATRDLSALERAGVVVRSEAGGRSTVYWVQW